MRTARMEEVFTKDGISFLDPDCYTRMFRVQQLQQHPFQPIHWHAFENYPEGLRSHATSLLDYIILIVAQLLRPFTSNALDWAGALISPLLGLALFVVLEWWSGLHFNTLTRITVLGIYALLPPLSWAQNIGRPDHQSLILFFLGVAWCLEFNLWRWPQNRYFQTLAGASWGLALWTSLYEPMVLLGIFLITFIGVRGLSIFKTRSSWWLSLGVVLILALLIEGGKLFAIVPMEHRFYLKRWMEGIGEMKHLSWIQTVFWFGGWFWLLPVWIVLGILRPPTMDRKLAILFGILTVSLAVLTYWQIRWSSFFALAICIFLVPVLMRLPGVLWRPVIAIFISIPLLFYYFHAIRLHQPNTQQQDLRHIAQVMRKEGAIMAPWWLSPPLLYFSGKPIIASSSHESISGIIDSSRFYAWINWPECEKILRQRKVRWVLAADPGQTLSQSLKILGLADYNESQARLIKDYSRTMAARLDNINSTPVAFKLRAVIRQFKLYEYVAADNNLQ